eukprot:SAG31_NODE_1605_length_7765_cov_2.124315_10_plen_100_part_00
MCIQIGLQLIERRKGLEVARIASLERPVGQSQQVVGREGGTNQATIARLHSMKGNSIHSHQLSAVPLGRWLEERPVENHLGGTNGGTLLLTVEAALPFV